MAEATHNTPRELAALVTACVIAGTGVFTLVSVMAPEAFERAVFLVWDALSKGLLL